MGAVAAQDELTGALAMPFATAEDLLPPSGTEPYWERVGVGGRQPLAWPALPAGDRLEVRWNAVGAARWIGSGVVLLETADRALEARSAASGDLLWRVASCAEPRLFDAESERVVRLGWAVGAWGAVELRARYETAFDRRRVGRYTSRGRATEREVVGRGSTTSIGLTLRVVVPDERWSSQPPRVGDESVGLGEALCGSELCLEDWDDDLVALALDPVSPLFAVQWRDESQPWEVFRVLGGDGAPPAVSWGGFSVDSSEDPFPPPEQPLVGPGGGRFRLAPDAVELWDGCAVLESQPAPSAEGAARIDGGLLLLVFDGLWSLHQLTWGEGCERRWADWPGPRLLEGRTLIPWGKPQARGATGRLLLAEEALYLQLGDERLVALGAPC